MSNTTRILSFPKDKGVGYLSEWNQETQSWDKIGEAQGEVAVAIDAQIRLAIWNLSPDSRGWWHESLDFLAVLEPNALACLELERIGSVNYNEEYFAPVATQTDLVGLKVGPTELALLPNSVRVQIRNLDLDSGDDDTLIKCVSKMTSLESLRGGGCHYTSEGIAALSSLPNLQYITLANNQPAIKGWAIKKLNKGLKKLVIDQISYEDFTFLREFPDLNMVGGFNDNWLDDEALKELRNCKKMRFIRLTHAHPVTDEGFKHISEFSELETLYADGAQITDSGLTAIKNNKKLRKLSLAKTKITGDGLNILENLIELVDLDLGECTLNQAAVDAISKLPNLKKLSLTRSDLTDCSLSPLALVQSLERLYLADATISGDIEELKKEMPNCEIFHGAVYR